MEAFEAYFKSADLNQDGRISGQEAVAFFQGSGLPQQTLAQVWAIADKNKSGFLGRPEFFNALRLVTVAQSGHALTPELVQSALFGPAAARIPAPKIATPAAAPTQMGAMAGQVGQMNNMAAPRPQGSVMMPPSSQFGMGQTNAMGVPRPQGNSTMMPPSTQMGALQPAQYVAPGGLQMQPPNVGVNLNKQPVGPSTSFMRPPEPVVSAALPQAQGVNQVMPGVSTMTTAPRPPNSTTMDLSVDWLGNKTGGSSIAGVSQAPPRAPAPTQAAMDGFGLSMPGTMGMTPGQQAQPSQLTRSLPPASATSGLQGQTTPLASSLQPMGMSPGQQAQSMPLASSLPYATNNAVLPRDSKALVVSGNGVSSVSGVGNDIFAALTQPKPSGSAPASWASAQANSSGLVSSSGALQSMQTATPVSSQVQQSTPSLFAPNISAAASNTTTSQWPKISKTEIQRYTKIFEDVDKDRDGKITGTQARNLFLSWKLPRDVLKQVWDLSDQDNDGMLSLREFCITLYLMERHRAGIPLPEALPDSVRFDETLLQATGMPSAGYNGPAWQQNPGALPHGAPGAPVMPAMGTRPPLPRHLPPQPGVVKSGLPRSSMPLMDNLVSANGQNTLHAENQLAAEDPKKEVEKQVLLDSKEKLEFYRTKMQDLVLYKSRCDNRLNEITERASADKREVESLGKKYEEKYKQVGELASKLAIEEATFRDVQERKLELQNAIVKMEQGGSVDGLLQVRADRIQHHLEELEKALSERCKHFELDFKPSASIKLPSGWEPGVQEGAVDWDEDWDKFEDQGFALVKDNGTVVENVVSAENGKSASLWNDDNELSPDASSNGHIKYDEHYGAGERVSENELGYEYEESARSSGSPRRSASESSFVPSQFGTHDTFPPTKDSYSDNGGAETNIFGDKYADESAWNFDDNDTESVWGPSEINTKDFGRVDSPGAAGGFGKKRSPFDDSVPNSPSFTSGFSPKFNESHDDSSYNLGRFDSFRSQESGFFPREQRFSRFDSVNSSKGDSLFPQDQGFSRFDSINSSKGDNLFPQDHQFSRFDSMSSSRDDNPFPQDQQFSRFDSMSSSKNFGHSRAFDSFDEADPFGSSGPFKALGSRSPTKS